jgi:clan AA aspartic protease (TIGR02281 family)
MKIPTFTAISVYLTLSACVSNNIGSGTTYNDTTNTDRNSSYDLCRRAASSRTESEEDNLEFYRNCLRRYGLVAEYNGVGLEGSGQNKYRIGSAEQRGDETLNNNTSIAHITKQGNSYYVPVRINDTITLPFLLDTGASDLVIPIDVALTLIRAGALKRSDFIGQTSYRMANGSEEVGDVVVLRDVRVGDHMVRNVSASITPAQGQPLLGQSFLSKFGTVTVDYKRLILVLSP